MKRVTFLAAMMAISVPAMADPAPMELPDFQIEKSCSLFTGHPRPQALCEDIESHYRAEVTDSWTRTPAPGREQCAKLASQSERGKYEVLARCLRAAISEAGNHQTIATETAP